MNTYDNDFDFEKAESECETFDDWLSLQYWKGYRKGYDRGFAREYEKQRKKLEKREKKAIICRMLNKRLSHEDIAYCLQCSVKRVKKVSKKCKKSRQK